MVSPNQVTARRESKNYAVGSDSQGNEFRVGDFMKESAGENRSGEVINIFRSLFVFLHNREVTDNNGVFVARSTALISVTPKSATNDLGKINPALNQALPYGGASLMPPPATNINKNRIVNTLVVVTKGTNKGLMGVIKDLQADNARVELATNNKILTINLTSLKRKDPKTGQTYPLDTGMSAPGMGMSTGRPPMGGYDMNPYGGAPPTNGGATPAWGAGGGRTPAPGRFGQTPNPYATAAGSGFGGGKTPNPYAAGGRTPAGAGFGGGGGKTPGWAGGGGMGGRTPAYGGGDGGKTPAYGGAAAGGRTPAYGAPAGGGRTPAWAGGGGAMDGRTPNPYAGPSGGRTPMPDASSSRYPPYAAPTPQSIPTRPANPYAAPTPYDSGPTPYGSAPTPAGAPTPAAAPTPAVAGGPTPFSAPTPYGGAPTPFGSQPAAPGTARDGGLPWDWAMDFWNIIIEVGPSSRSGTKNPRHHQRGAIDGRRFGLQAHHDNDTIEIVALDDPTFKEMLPSEYARPVRPDGSGQVCVTILGDNKGSQRTTQYENDGQWMMEMEPDDASQLVMDGQALCRIWRVGQE
jgi:transcription elongation factor SPT5